MAQTVPLTSTKIASLAPAFPVLARGALLFTGLIFLTVVARPFSYIPQNLLPLRLSDQRSIDAETPEAYFSRGEKLMLFGSPSDAQKGLSLLELSATRGSSKAACELAAYYRWMRPDVAKLARWMPPCTEQHPTADRETVMAELYLQGQGVPVNASEAVRWYERAATHGGTQARQSLFYIYRDGRGEVHPDSARAVRYAVALTAQRPANEDAVAYLLEQVRKRDPQALAWARQWERLKTGDNTTNSSD